MASAVEYLQTFLPRWARKRGKHWGYSVMRNIFTNHFHYFYIPAFRFSSLVYCKDYGNPISQSFVRSLLQPPAVGSLPAVQRNSFFFSYHFIGHFNHEFFPSPRAPLAHVFDFSKIVDTRLLRGATSRSYNFARAKHRSLFPRESITFKGGR